MGFLSFLKGATRGARTISLDASLGNVLISGNSKKGTEVIIKNYAIDSINKGCGVVIFRDQVTGVSSYPSITTSSRIIYEIDCADNSTTEQIDLFSGLNENDINSFIIKLFDSYNEIDKTKKMSYMNYLSLLRSLTKKAGKNIKINELVDYPIEEVENLNIKYCTNPMEQSRNDRFLSSIRSEIRDLEAYFYDFSQNVIGYVLSGTKSLEKIFQLKPIIEISLDYSGKPDESRIIMSSVIDAINRFNLSLSTVSSINVIVDGAPNDILTESGLHKLIKGGRGFNALYTIQDISNLVEKSNEWIDFADSYFYFKQTSNKNKEFCSEFFGTYEKRKESVTKGTSNASFWDRMNGHGGSTRQDSKTVTYEKERVYLPEVFSGLPDNQAIFYSKKNNEHTYLTVY